MSLTRIKDPVRGEPFDPFEPPRTPVAGQVEEQRIDKQSGPQSGGLGQKRLAAEHAGLARFEGGCIGWPLQHLEERVADQLESALDMIRVGAKVDRKSTRIGAGAGQQIDVGGVRQTLLFANAVGDQAGQTVRPEQDAESAQLRQIGMTPVDGEMARVHVRLLA